MVKVTKLIQVYNAPLIPFIPLIAAGIGVGATVYTQNKAEDAAKEKSATDAMRNRESQKLSETKMDQDRARDASQAQARNMANANAEEAALGTMENVAEGEKYRLSQEKLMAQENQQAEYASKFSPGQGGLGEDTASDFLVPKVADDTGLVRSNDTGNAGLNTPLGFAV